jgi:hypothetical protein
VTGRRLSAFVDALASGRRPKRFRAGPADAEVLRTAVTLRAARPGEAAPTEAFVEGLYQQLTEQASPEPVPAIPPAPRRRARTALVAVAAGVSLVAGTTVATETLRRPGPAPTATAPIPQGRALRTGSFQTADGQVLGQIVAYRGHPSWVFMNVDVPRYEGPVECRLQVDNGTTVAFGTFSLHGGTGQYSKDISEVSVDRLRGAMLVSAAGTPVAAATFAG